MSLTDSLTSFTQGFDPTATRLMLGDFEFLGLEVPERVIIAGRQKTVAHQLIGGKRVIDVLGTEYEPLTWSGIITGAQADERVRELERLRDAGQPVVLTLDKYRFIVMITAFNPVWEFIWRRPYTLEAAIIRNEGSPDRVDALTGALQSLIDSDLGRALGLSSLINIDTVTQAVKSLHQAVRQVTDFAHATVDQIQSVVRPIIAARNIIHQELALLEAAAGTLTSLGGLMPGNPVSETVSNLLAQADHVTRIPALYRMQEVLGHLSKNVNAGPASGGVITVTLSGGNLYQVASEQYGDASLWGNIANANNLADPQLSGIQTLRIPGSPGSD